MKQGSAQSHVERVEIHSCFCVGPKCERGPPSAAIFALSEQSASRFASIALVLPSSCLFVVQLMALAMILTETQHRQMLLNKRDELERSILKHKEALRDDRILLKETQNALDKYKRKGAKEQVTLVVQATEPTPNKKRGRVDSPAKVVEPVPMATRKLATPTPNIKAATPSKKGAKAKPSTAKATTKPYCKRVRAPPGICPACWARQQKYQGGRPHTYVNGCAKRPGAVAAKE